MISTILCFIIKACIFYIFLTKITIDPKNWWDIIIVIGLLIIIDFFMNIIPNSAKTSVMRRANGLDNVNFAMVIYYTVFGILFFVLYDQYKKLAKMNNGTMLQIGALAICLFLYNFLYKMILRIGSYNVAECFAVNTGF